MKSTLKLSEQEALLAVRNRDSAYDGQFFFAVLTTGIYCRPSCSARAAKKENLRFFSDIEQAELAGFRACKRCRPEQVKSDRKNNDTMVLVARYIENNSDQKITLDGLAEQFKLSSAHLQKRFKATFGLSPREFHNGIKQHRFKALMRDGCSVTDALYSAGYGSSSRVYESSDKELGMTPGTYKSGGQGETMVYTCAHTRIGYLMLAATEKGVCFAMFDDEEQQLLTLLQQEFPAANLVKSSDGDQIDDWYREIERYLSAETTMPDIPLDLRGTTFQLRVWHFIQSVADGETVSYSEVANGIDNPAAFRAAATACGKNRIALLVPCHRVLRGDGSMGGYRWGVGLKRELLEMEAQIRAKGHQ